MNFEMTYYIKNVYVMKSSMLKLIILWPIKGAKQQVKMMQTLL